MIFPNLSKIRTFVCVAEQTSFRKAAESLHLSQPALSAHVRDLEAMVGVPLFHRTTRSVQLTKEGVNFLARAKRALYELESGIAELHDQASLQRGRVIVGSVPTIASHVLPDVIATFTSRYPGINLRILDVSARNQEALVLNREVDVAIGPPPERAEDVAFEPILRDPFVCVCARGHALASRRRIRLGDLTAYPLLMLTTGNVRSVLEKAFAEQGLTLRPAYEFVHHYTLGGMVAAGIGITALPTIAISLLNNSLLKTLKIVDPEVSREIGILRRRDQLPTPAVQAFLAALNSGWKRMRAKGSAYRFTRKQGAEAPGQ